MADLERRFTSLAVELRASENNKRTIAGYAAVFNRNSENLGGFVEIVNPRFFNKSRGDGFPGVMARYNHEILLGTTKAGTLRLSIDDQGLWYDVDPPQARADILELVERGDVTKSSFAFRCYEDDWTLSDQGFPMRTLMSGQLIDVAPVDQPAYPDTSVGLRSLADKFDADINEVRKLAEELELRKFFVRTDGPAPVKPASTSKAKSGASALAELMGKMTDPYL